MLQLLILAATEVLRVDDDALIAAEVAPIRRVDDVLQRVEALALAAQQHLAVLAEQLDTQAAVLEILELDVHRQPHRVYQVLDEGAHVSVKLLLSWSCRSDRRFAFRAPPSIFFGSSIRLDARARLRAGRRACGW